MKLDDFLTLPDISGLTKEIKVSDRIGTVKIGALTSAEFDEITKRCRKIDKKGKISLDEILYKLSVIESKLIEPDFSNAEFLSKAKCNTAKEFISKKLLPGEISTIVSAIEEFSGFDQDINDDVEEAKN